MTVAVPSRRQSAVSPSPLTAAEAAALPAPDVLGRLGSGPEGLPEDEAQRRLQAAGPNAVRSHRARAWPVLARQLRSPLLGLLAATALASAFVGQASDAVIIGAILVASVGLGFANEYKAEKTAEALHSSIRHRCVVLRGGHPRTTDVTELVPGDVVDLQLGQVVPADLRLLATAGLECDESVLTGESLPAEKSPEPVPAGTPLAELASCALMGTVVQAGSGTGVVVATGGQAEFGRIALGLGERQPETEFQAGLRKFSMLLVQVAGVLTTAIFVINVTLHRPVIDALLFSLAIAVGISPQLLPAVVSTSLAAGARQLARRKVLVKRLVCIEDLGNVDVLFTDKTGTLTEGSLRFMRSAGPDGTAADEPLLLGLLCNEAVTENGRAAGGNPLDVALWDSPAAARQRTALARYRRLATVPFDHERRLVSVLAEDDQGNRMVITKGAPEGLLDRCADVPGAARTALEAEFAAGNRVIAVATREAPGQSSLTAADEHDLRFRGLLVFLDPPKPDARAALRPAGQPRHHGQDPHRGQPGRGGEGLRRPRPAARAGGHRRRHRQRGRPARRPDRRDHGLRPGQPRAQGPGHPGAAARRNRRGLPRRRGQRRRRAARRRRRHLGGLGHRRGQGRRRRAAAGKGPGRARRRRRWAAAGSSPTR